eukprot:TRINITY_DN1009_c0_g3_i2.p1 TRINITY_DN1009_c0_g3~~TRINITY_DN1009_c0_g3_i2.p1  ORF type:complete len:409 (+),score=193.35 TRINITY_DN1009_c0_g3_i2:66-1229(+)
MDAFTLDVGCDLFGSKVNVEMKFQNGCPPLQELMAAIETEFDTRSRATRPAGYPDMPFKIEMVQVFDDAATRWVDLFDINQLRHKAQLWAFQPESIWHSDAQGVIPDPEKKLCTFTTPLGSPRRARIATDAGVPPTLSEKLRSVFYQIDGQNKGYILHEDLQRAFQQCDMEFTYATAGELFSQADLNRSQHITYDEWVNFAIKAPSLIDALFFRFRDMQNVAPQPNYGSPGRPMSMPMQSMPQQSYAQPQQSYAQPQYSQLQDDARHAEEQARAAAAQASQLQAQAAAAQQAAQQAAERQQQAAEAARAAQQQQMSNPAPQSYYGAQPSMGAPASPQREAALREYEAARRRADEIRMAKEEAEREERNAWDRCYYSPGQGSPQQPRY